MDAEKHYRDRLEVFAGETVTPGGIVLVGSSHVERFDAERFLAGRHVVNRGIACDRIGIGPRGILRRLEVSIFACRPAVVILENGANDLGELWRNGAPSVEDTAECYERVVSAIRDRLPAIPMSLVNIAPTSGQYAGMSPLAPQLNRHIKSIAGRFGCHYMDIYGACVDPDGYLKGEVTTDGLHMNDEGYRIWAELIESFLESGGEVA